MVRPHYCHYTCMHIQVHTSKAVIYNSAVCFASRSIEVVLPDPPPEYKSLPHWLSELTDSKLKKLLEQGDSQRVRELSLAFITVLNEVGEASPPSTD